MDPEVVLDSMVNHESLGAYIDVRSEGEYANGHFVGSLNIPILNDSHRHEVGLTYKKLGQDRAIELGYKLVSPTKTVLVEKYLKALVDIPEDQRFIYCWRGGLRSQLAQEWIQDKGVKVNRVVGGFKALRNTALKVFEEFPPIFVLGGMTGSGKTKIIKSIQSSIDLEGIAAHRGSAFGSFFAVSQPSQVTFENSLALSLWRRKDTIVLEDESVSIGKLRLPIQLYIEMAKSPLVLVDISLEERAHNIYQEYIASALVNSESLRQHYLNCLQKISNKLGGAKTTEIYSKIIKAFDEGVVDEAAHRDWIADLLLSYYDKLYNYSLAKKSRSIVFRGNNQECEQWLKENTNV
ncbi:MAG: tRNA 2-selenouridine(34) synthase MnmH [Bdellovibrionaceae bacterium]|nr:tRNA 2-selenouridine(34) synthase MnmH [Pseudobdellovibrionaceae bacterium]